MRPTQLLGALALLAMGVAGTAVAADIEAGKAKSSSCAVCHGASGEGKGTNPKIAGLPQGQFVQMMKDYSSGKRPSGVMKGYAAKLSDEETANLAAYYASLKK
jgi:cytochrome c553